MHSVPSASLSPVPLSPGARSRDISPPGAAHQRAKILRGLMALVLLLSGLGGLSLRAEAATGPLLAVSMTQPPNPLGPGQTTTVAVTVTNYGDAPGAAGTVRAMWVPANLFASLTVTTASTPCLFTANGSYRYATCDYPALAPGESRQVANVTVLAPNPVSYAGITFDFTFSGAYTGAATVTFHIQGIGPADLVAGLQVPPMPLLPGALATATMPIENRCYTPTGPFAWRVDLPTGSTSSSLTVPAGTTCTPVADRIECETPNLAPGGYAVLRVSFTASHNAGMSPVMVSLDTAATVDEADETNNVASTPVAVYVDMASPPDPIGPGQTVISVITATNSGATPSVPGTLVVTRPKTIYDGTVLVSVSGTVFGACSTTLPRGSNYRKTTCPLPALAPGQTATVARVRVVAPTTLPYAGITFVVNVAGPVDTASARYNMRASGPADLVPSVSLNPLQALSGYEVTGYITIGNWGYSAVGAFTTSLHLPAGATAVVPMPSPGTTCTTLRGTVTCSTTAIPPGGSLSIPTTFLAPATAGSYTATVTADTANTVVEAQEGNNTATSAPITVFDAAADLSTSIVNPSAPIPAGSVFTRTLTVANVGNAEALNVFLSDRYGPPFGYVGFSGPADTTCQATYVTVQFNRKRFTGASCSLGTIPAGGTVTVTIKVSVPATTAAGTYSDTTSASTSSFRVPNDESSASATVTVYQPVTPLPPTNTVLPVVQGVAVIHNTLTSSNGTWLGATPITYAYQWQRCQANGTACLDIAGATASSYVISAADVNAALRAVVTATNIGGATPAASAAVGPVMAPTIPVNTVRPALLPGAEKQPGFVWGVTTGTWTGTAPLSYTYQWQRCQTNGTGCVPIVGATSASYLLTNTDVFMAVRVLVTATNGGGSATATSNLSGEIDPWEGN